MAFSPSLRLWTPGSTPNRSDARDRRSSVRASGSTRPRLLGLAVLTGLALPLAFSIWRVPWLAWVAVVPLLIAARRAKSRRCLNVAR